MCKYIFYKSRIIKFQNYKNHKLLLPYQNSSCDAADVLLLLILSVINMNLFFLLYIKRARREIDFAIFFFSNKTFQIDFEPPKRNIIWYQINQKIVITIQIWFNLTGFRNGFFCVFRNIFGARRTSVFSRNESEIVNTIIFNRNRN